MEVVLVFVAIFVGWIIVRLILGALGSTVGAAAKAATGQGTFSDNMALAFKGMQPLECRLVDDRLESGNPESPALKAVEVKGQLPVQRTGRASFVISILDTTDGEPKPVLSALDMFQEPNTVAYQFISELGEIGPDQGFVSWQRIGVVFPEMLMLPRGGERTLKVVLRLVDENGPPEIALGFSDGEHPGFLGFLAVEFRHHFDGKGYEDDAAELQEARALAVKIGIAVAFADGTYDEVEGEVVKDFVRRVVAPFEGDKLQQLKDLYNQAIREAYEAAQTGSLSLSELTSGLKAVTEPSGRYEAIELCFEVMAADGVADPGELETIRKVAGALELDFEEIEKLKDKTMLNLSTETEQASIEALLGIEEDWPEAKVNRHLRAEFKKWNGRLNTLPEGVERENAQRMLDMIAEARTRYS